MTPDEKILETARKRFKAAAEATTEQRDKSLKDLRFYAGDQWEDKAKMERAGRPCLVINKLPQSARQVTNQQRMNRPGIAINPVDDFSDPDTAEILQGLIRHIEVQSGYHPYDTAFESCVRIGFGYWRVLTEYIDENSFDQEIILKAVPNAFTVYMDPASVEPDGSDATYAFVSEEITVDEFKEQYPGHELGSLENYQHLGDEMRGWAPEGKIRLAEYYYRDEKDRTLLSVTSERGEETIFEDEIPGDGTTEEKLAALGYTETNRRKVKTQQVKWCKINGNSILDRTDWPSKFIPIVPVLGDQLWIEGKRDLKGIVRDAIDPQRMNNYWASKETETIAQTPLAPYIGTARQFQGYEDQWEQASNRPKAFLVYNQDSVGGRPVPPPSRMAFEPAIQAIAIARQQASDDLEDVTGLHGPSLGKRQRADSGKAIEKLQREGSTANYHYSDNLSRALRHTGRILIELIPKIYDVERVRRITGDDEQERRVVVTNDPNGPPVSEREKPEGGIEQIYNIGVGRYDVTVSTGPSFSTKRQEALNGLLELTKAYPDLVAIAGDLLVKMMDFPLAQELAERLKKQLPEGVIEDEEGGKPLPPAVQQKLQEMGQMIEGLTESLNEANEELDKKLPEIQSRERIEQAKLQLEKLKIDLQHTEKMAELRLKADIANETLTSKEEIAELDSDTKLEISKSSSVQDTAEG